MKKLTTCIAASLLVAIGATSSVQAQERSGLTMSAAGAEQRSKVSFSVDTRGIQQEARKLESSLKRSPELREKLATAMAEKNTRQVQAVLAEAGISRGLLNSDNIVMAVDWTLCIGKWDNGECKGIFITNESVQ